MSISRKMILQLLLIRQLKCLLSVLLMSTLLNFGLVSSDSKRVRVISPTEPLEELAEANQNRDFSSSNDDENQLPSELSCIEPDKSDCGTLTLYTCAKEQSGLSSVTVTSENVISSCRLDAYARLERANLLRCRANLSELLSRFALESSVMGINFTSNVVSLIHYFYELNISEHNCHLPCMAGRSNKCSRLHGTL